MVHVSIMSAQTASFMQKPAAFQSFLPFPAASCASLPQLQTAKLYRLSAPSSAETMSLLLLFLFRLLLLLVLFPEQKHLLRLGSRLETCLCPAPCKTSQNTGSQAGAGSHFTAVNSPHRRPCSPTSGGGRASILF